MPLSRIAWLATVAICLITCVLLLLTGYLGYAGVLVFSPDGKLLGRIRLPEICANLAFGGPKRDHLFMCASQSLYMLLVQTQGAAPG